MVFENLFSQIVNLAIGKYVNIDVEKLNLNVAIWKGDISLSNLELKCDVLNCDLEKLLQYKIPLRLSKGFIGTLQLQIPWSNLKSESIVINIHDVYLILDTYDESSEQKHCDKENLTKLKQVELLELDSLATSQTPSNATHPGLVSALVEKIVANVQIQINKVHIVYQHQGIAKDVKFSVGMVLEHLSILSTNQNFEPMFISEAIQDQVFKLLTMKSFSLYCAPHILLPPSDPNSNISVQNWIEIIQTHHNQKLDEILSPVMLTIKAHLDKKKHTTTADMSFGTIDMKLQKQTYNNLVQLVHDVRLLMLRIQHDSIRPKESPKTNRMAWWWFVVKACQTPRFRITAQDIQKRRQQRLLYERLYSLVLKKSISPSEQEQLGELEKELNVTQIMGFRYRAREALQKEGYRVEEKPKQSWFSWLVHQAEEKDPEQTPQQLKTQLYSILDFHESKEETVDNAPSQIELQLHVEGGSVEFIDDEAFLKGLFSKFSSHVAMTGPSAKVSIGLGTVELLDMTPNCRFPELISVSKDVPSEGEYQEFEFFCGTFHWKPPQEPDMQFALEFRAKPLQFVCDNAILSRINNFLSGAIPVDWAQYAPEVNKEYYSQQLQHLVKQRFNFRLDIVIHAPKFIFPDTVTTQNETTLLFADLGDLFIKTTESSDTSEGLSASEEQLYSHLKLSLQSVQLQLIDAQTLLDENTHSTIIHPTNSRHIVQDFDIELNVDYLSVPDIVKLPNLPHLKVSATLPSFVISVSPRTVLQVQRILMQSFQIFNTTTVNVAKHQKLTESHPTEQPLKKVEPMLQHKNLTGTFHIDEFRIVLKDNEEVDFCDMQLQHAHADIDVVGSVIQADMELYELTIRDYSRQHTVLSSYYDSEEMFTPITSITLPGMTVDVPEDDTKNFIQIRAHFGEEQQSIKIDIEPLYCSLSPQTITAFLAYMNDLSQAIQFKVPAPTVTLPTVSQGPQLTTEINTKSIQILFQDVPDEANALQLQAGITALQVKSFIHNGVFTLELTLDKANIDSNYLGDRMSHLTTDEEVPHCITLQLSAGAGMSTCVGNSNDSEPKTAVIVNNITFNYSDRVTQQLMKTFTPQNVTTPQDTQSTLRLIQQWARMKMDFVLDIHHSTVAICDKNSALIVAFDQIHADKCRDLTSNSSSDEDLATAIIHGGKISFIEELATGRQHTALLDLNQDVKAALILHSLGLSSLILKVQVELAAANISAKSLISLIRFLTQYGQTSPNTEPSPLNLLIGLRLGDVTLTDPEHSMDFRVAHLDIEFSWNNSSMLDVNMVSHALDVVDTTIPDKSFLRVEDFHLQTSRQKGRQQGNSAEVIHSLIDNTITQVTAFWNVYSVFRFKDSLTALIDSLSTPGSGTVTYALKVKRTNATISPSNYSNETQEPAIVVDTTTTVKVETAGNNTDIGIKLNAINAHYLVNNTTSPPFFECESLSGIIKLVGLQNDIQAVSLSPSPFLFRLALQDISSLQKIGMKEYDEWMIFRSKAGKSTYDDTLLDLRCETGNILLVTLPLGQNGDFSLPPLVHIETKNLDISGPLFKVLQMSTQLHMRYFNLMQSFWEPLMERTRIDVTYQHEEDLHKLFLRGGAMQINITHYLIDTLVMWFRPAELQKRNPLLRGVDNGTFQLLSISNMTPFPIGYRLSEMHDVHQVAAYQSGSVPVLQSAPSANSSLDIFDLSWLRNSTLSVSINGQHIENLPLKNGTRELIELPNFPVRAVMVYEVHFIAGRRILWFGSPFKIINKSYETLSLVFRKNNNPAEYWVEIPSQGISSIPFHLLNETTTTFYVHQKLDQDSFHTSAIELHKILNKVLSSPQSHIDLVAQGDHSPRFYSMSAISNESNLVTLCISEPFRIKNELPFAIHLRAAKQVEDLRGSASHAELQTMNLEPGTNGYISRFARSEPLFIQVLIEDYLWSEPIQVGHAEEGVIPAYHTYDTLGSNPIAIEYELRGGHDLKLFSPFIIENYTEFTMRYFNTRKAVAAQSDARQIRDLGQYDPSVWKPRVHPTHGSQDIAWEPSTRLFGPNPMLKLKEFAPFLQLENSQPIGELDYSVMQSGFFEVRENDHHNSYYIAIQVTKDRVSPSHIVKFAPRVMIHNTLQRPVWYKQTGALQDQKLENGQLTSFHWDNQTGFKQKLPNQLLQISLDGKNWSTGFPLDQESTQFSYILRNNDKNVPASLVEIVQSRFEGCHSSTVVKLVEKPLQKAPFIIRNLVKGKKMLFWQHQNPNVRYELLPDQQMHYTFDDWTKPKKICVAMGNVDSTWTSIKEDWTIDLCSISAPKVHSQWGIQTDVSLDNSVRIFTAKSVQQPPSSQDTIMPQTQEEFKGATWGLQVRAQISELGISIIDSTPQELMRLYMSGFRWKCETSYETFMTQLNLKYMQIDNCLLTPPFPVMLQPQKAVDGDFLQFVYIQPHPYSTGNITAIDSCGLMMADSVIKIDAQTLELFWKFVKQSQLLTLYKSIEQLQENIHYDDQLYYFRAFQIFPVSTQITFLNNTTKQSKYFYKFLRKSVGSFVRYIPSIESLSISFAALSLKHPLIAGTELLDILRAHYTHQLKKQALKVIGSVSLFGHKTPLKIIYEPARVLGKTTEVLSQSLSELVSHHPSYHEGKDIPQDGVPKHGGRIRPPIYFPGNLLEDYSLPKAACNFILSAIDGGKWRNEVLVDYFEPSASMLVFLTRQFVFLIKQNPFHTNDVSQYELVARIHYKGMFTKEVLNLKDIMAMSDHPRGLLLQYLKQADKCHSLWTHKKTQETTLLIPVADMQTLEQLHKAIHTQAVALL